MRMSWASSALEAILNRPWNTAAIQVIDTKLFKRRRNPCQHKHQPKSHHRRKPSLNCRNYRLGVCEQEDEGCCSFAIAIAAQSGLLSSITAPTALTEETGRRRGGGESSLDNAR